MHSVDKLEAKLFPALSHSLLVGTAQAGVPPAYFFP